MEQIVIRGGKPMYGTIAVSGFKNSALPVLYATILTGDVCVLDNIPSIRDVQLTLEILRAMGANVRLLGGNSVEIDTKNVVPGAAPAHMVKRLRASSYIMGAELGRFGQASVGWPGGCDFCDRPIDQHIKAFEALGAQVICGEDGISVISDGLHGDAVYFDLISVGATVNAIMSAVLAEGETVLENVAREPHIVDLANFLNMCGASIRGAGTSQIKITGVKALHGCRYEIIPDMIEAGTYMIAVAATGGELRICNVVPKHLESISAKLCDMGAAVTEGDDYVTVKAEHPLTCTKVRTSAYPGFPTDMHPQMSVLMTVAEGVSTMQEGIFDHRFRYVEELQKMGARISVSGNLAVIEGSTKLRGAAVHAVDLRAGAALIIAGLIASGETTVTGMEIVERGYDNVVGKLRAIGMEIEAL